MTHVLLSAKGERIASGKTADFGHVAPDERVVVERPILFSAPMVRALLDGRKTQTRRIAKGITEKPTAVEWGAPVVVGRNGDTQPGPDVFAAWGEDWHVRCPYGAPGDRLWVKETFAHDGSRNHEVPYRATWACKRDYPGVPCEHGPDRWRPSIFMPRWASRITLEVTGVRVERVQAISGSDAIAEGVRIERCGCEVCARSSALCPADASTAIEEYRSLWESINGAESWGANPWVWVVEFRRVTP